jgi:hypothetical protein
MKFLSFALAALLGPASEAAKSLSGNELNDMLQSGKVDAKTLLRSAVPYNKRKLQDEEEDAESQGSASDLYGYLAYGGEITGDHSVIFNSCVSLTVEEEWEDMDNYEYFEDYIAAGKIQSVRSFILFNVCKTRNDCAYGQDDTQNTYMVELNTFVSSLLNYMPDQKDDYCEGCVNQQQYCTNIYANGYDQSIDYNTASFFYEDIKYQLIDCTQCLKYGCYSDEDTYDQNGWEDVAGWVEDIVGCLDTGAQWSGVDLMAGWMCNEAGTGMEIGVFVDDECTLYNSMKSYSKLLEDGAEEWEYYGKSQRVVNYLFKNQFDCYGGDIIYVNLFQQVYMEEEDWSYDPCQYESTTGYYFNQEECEQMISENPCYIPSNNTQYYQQQAEEEEGEYDEEACAEFMEDYPCWHMPGEEVAEDYQEACYEYEAQFAHEASEACYNLFTYGENLQATALSTCAYNYEANEAEEGYQDGSQAEEEENDWNLTYDIYQEDAEVEYATCYYVEELYNGGNLQTTQVYNSDTSGTMYDYEEDGSGESNSYFPTNNVKNAMTQSKKKMSNGAIISIALLVAGGVFATFWVSGRVAKSIRRKKEAEMIHSDPKKTPFLT